MRFEESSVSESFNASTVPQLLVCNSNFVASNWRNIVANIYSKFHQHTDRFRVRSFRYSIRIGGN